MEVRDKKRALEREFKSDFKNTVDSIQEQASYKFVLTRTIETIKGYMDENDGFESMQMAPRISIRRIDQYIRGLYSTYTIKEIKDQNREITILRFTKCMIPQRINIEDYINVIEVYDQYHKAKKNQSFIYMDQINQRNHHKTNMAINNRNFLLVAIEEFNSGGIMQPQEYSSAQQNIHLLLLFKSYSFEYINKIDYFNQRILKDLKFKLLVNRTKEILNYLKIRKIFYLVQLLIMIYQAKFFIYFIKINYQIKFFNIYSQNNFIENLMKLHSIIVEFKIKIYSN